MNYQETLEYLYNAAPAFEKVGAGAYKEGLSTTLALDEHFHHPHHSFKTVHVAGTNGKGSTSHMIAAILQRQGYRVGLYTSPHLVDFNERIRVNGCPISHDYVIRFVEEERDFFEPLQPSFFELTTALAFKYFADEHVDYAVIEVGLGGRLDCTNIITPCLSIITNISFDHTAFLGNTLSAIAREKAGIIKHGVPVVIGEYTDETLPVFSQVAEEKHAPITFAQDEDITSMPHCQLQGYCQEHNVRTVLVAASILTEQGVITDTSCIDYGISHVCDLTHLRGRWETVSTAPLVICDTGHNLAGWEILSRQIADRFKTLQEDNAATAVTLRIVFGMVDDKDVDHVLRLLPPFATYYFTQASTHRAIPVDTLMAKASDAGLHGTPFSTVAEAYYAALSQSSPSDLIFVGGSSYVVADFLTLFSAPA